MTTTLATWPTERELILQAVEDRMKEIQGKPPYLLKVQTVSRDLKAEDQLKDDDYPAIFIIPPRERLAHKFFQKKENDLELIFKCYPRAAKEGESLAVLKEMLIHDVKVAFYQDITWGLHDPDTNQRLVVTSLLGPDILTQESSESALAVIEIQAIINYRHLRRTP